MSITGSLAQTGTFCAEMAHEVYLYSVLNIGRIATMLRKWQKTSLYLAITKRIPIVGTKLKETQVVWCIKLPRLLWFLLPVESVPGELGMLWLAGKNFGAKDGISIFHPSLESLGGKPHDPMYAEHKSIS
jgi:hypothetical protein